MNKIVKRVSIFLLTIFCMGIFSVQTTAAADGVVAGVVRWDENHSGTVAANPVIYQFSLSQSGKVAVTYTFSNTNNDSGNYRFVIRDKAGNNLVYEHVGVGTHIVSADLIAGDYEIAMWHYIYFDANLIYSFVPSFQASGETVSESNANRNNEVGAASSYTVNTSRTGQFALNDDVDIYKMTLKKNGILKFTVDSGIQALDFAVKNNMDDVSYQEYGVSVGKHVYSYFCPKGTYYITFSSKNTGTYSFKASLKDIPAASLKKAANTSGKCLLVNWSRKEEASGYQIQYSTNSKFKKGNKSYLVTGNQTDSVTISSLKLKQKYYVRVRTYITDKNGKKYYSGWSKVKTVTIKK